MHILLFWAVLGTELNLKLVALKSTYEAEGICFGILAQIPFIALYQSRVIHRLPWSSEPRNC